jgi:hypothetical protein
MVPALLLLAIAVVVVARARAGFAAASFHFTPERHPQTAWAPCNRNARSSAPSTFTPLSDRAAARLVTHEPETRPTNDAPFMIGSTRYPPPNEYAPRAAQLAAFRSARTQYNQTAVQFNPYLRFVDGRDGLRRPSTDDLIQWAAHKWGIPEDWLRAEYVLESYWNMYQLGDSEPVSAQQYREYPLQSRVPGSLSVYQSLGITQGRWQPTGADGVGSEPLRWQSTAFNIDYQAATVRFFYDNPQKTRTLWGDSSYRPCMTWRSISGWFASYPWMSTAQAGYIAEVKHELATRAWRSSDFLRWTLTDIPPHVRLLRQR